MLHGRPSATVTILWVTGIAPFQHINKNLPKTLITLHGSAKDFHWLRYISLVPRFPESVFLWMRALIFQEMKQVVIEIGLGVYPHTFDAPVVHTGVSVSRSLPCPCNNSITSHTSLFSLPWSTRTVDAWSTHHCSHYHGPLALLMPGAHIIVLTTMVHSHCWCLEHTSLFSLPWSTRTVDAWSTRHCSHYHGPLALLMPGAHIIVLTTMVHSHCWCLEHTSLFSLPWSTRTIDAWSTHHCSHYHGPLALLMPGAHIIVLTTMVHSHCWCLEHTSLFSLPWSTRTVDAWSTHHCSHYHGPLALLMPGAHIIVLTTMVHSHCWCLEHTSLFSLPWSTHTIDAWSTHHCSHSHGPLTLLMPGAHIVLTTMVHSHCWCLEHTLFSLPWSTRTIDAWSTHHCSHYHGPLALLMPGAHIIVLTPMVHSHCWCLEHTSLFSLPWSTRTVDAWSTHHCSHSHGPLALLMPGAHIIVLTTMVHSHCWCLEHTSLFSLPWSTHTVDAWSTHHCSHYHGPLALLWCLEHTSLFSLPWSTHTVEAWSTHHCSHYHGPLALLWCLEHTSLFSLPWSTRTVDAWSTHHCSHYHGPLALLMPGAHIIVLTTMVHSHCWCLEHSIILIRDRYANYHYHYFFYFMYRCGHFCCCDPL